MLYMPATTAATPVVLQPGQSAALQSTSRYYMLQSAPIVPAVPVMNTTLVYPRYGFVPKPVETSVTKDELEKSQTPQLVEVMPTVQHVVHHHVHPCGGQTCPGYCELCCPWIDQTQRRNSRRDQFERDEFDRDDPYKGETIDEKIERIRRELRQSATQQRDNSTETVEHHIHHQRPRSRSGSSRRPSSAPREPWRPSSQNDYPWRDAHLPAYREATLARSQTPVDQTRTWHETAHERSHQNTRSSASYYNKKDFVYRPKSETEAKKWYTQSTGKDPDREVHQALRGGTTSYQYTGTPAPSYERHQASSYDHSFYGDVPSSSTKTHTLRKIDSTHHHDLYASNHSSLHVIPKQGSTMDPPYMKILNAPVTYIH